MRSFIRPAVLGIGMLAVLAGARAEGFEDIILSDTEDAEEGQDSFATNTPKIYLSATITDEVASGSKLTVVWFALDTGGAAPANYRIDEASFAVGDNHVDVSLSRPTWLAGRQLPGAADRRWRGDGDGRFFGGVRGRCLGFA
jgi:hypothetical protein